MAANSRAHPASSQPRTRCQTWSSTATTASTIATRGAVEMAPGSGPASRAETLAPSGQQATRRKLWARLAAEGSLVGNQRVAGEAVESLGIYRSRTESEMVSSPLDWASDLSEMVCEQVDWVCKEREREKECKSVWPKYTKTLRHSSGRQRAN